MAQHGNRHPDDLLPAGDAARQLTPDEIQTIHDHAEQWLVTNDAMVGQWLHQLPSIPPQPADRSVWAAGLPDRERSMYEDLEATRAHLRPIEAALCRADYRLLLDLLTQAQPSDEERTVRKNLYDIRDAVEQRLGDAVTTVIADAQA